MSPLWETFCKRTNDPKLTYIEHKLTAMGIPHRRHGESAHAPILEIPSDFLEQAYAFLAMPFDGEDDQTVDDMADDDPVFWEMIWSGECQPHDWLGISPNLRCDSQRDGILCPRMATTQRQGVPLCADCAQTHDEAQHERYW